MVKAPSSLNKHHILILFFFFKTFNYKKVENVIKEKSPFNNNIALIITFFDPIDVVFTKGFLCGLESSRAP